MELYERLLEYASLGNVAHGAVLALGRYPRELPLPQKDREALSRAVDHLGQAQEGFHLTLRATSIRDLRELRQLVERLLLIQDWPAGPARELWPEELEVVAQEENAVSWPRLQVFIFAHTLTALAVLPRLRASDLASGSGQRAVARGSGQTAVGDPAGSSNYADIPFPRSPTELQGRLEEVEGVVWQAMGGPPGQVEADPLRRAYGFFEASRWLVANHLRLFLGREPEGAVGGREAA